MPDTVTITEETINVVEVGTPGPEGPPGTGGVFPIGRVLVVDSVNGSDSTGTRGRLDLPFLTPGAAKAAASSGDTILVYPGAYTCTASLAKAGVNWRFHPGASVTMTDGGSVGIWDDGGTAMTFAVTGAGTFALVNTLPGVTAAVINCSHASSNIFSECLDIAATDDNTDGDNVANLIGVNCQAGRLVVRCRDVVQTSANYRNGSGIWWQNGALDVVGSTVDGEVAAFYANVAAAPTGDADLRFAQIGAAANIGVYDSGSNAAAAWWVRANRIKGVGNSVQAGGAGRGYVEAQKLFGCVALTGTGLPYVRADKVTNAGSNGLLRSSGTAGEARVEVNHWDGTGVTAAAFVFNSAGQTVNVLGGEYVAPSGGNGVSHTAGTVRLRGTRIDTSANNAGNPVTVAGAGLLLDRCTLIANSGRDSVTAASAKTVTSYGSVANTAANGNVTVNVQALTVDSNVV